MADDQLVDTLQKIRDVPGNIVSFAKRALGEPADSPSNGSPGDAEAAKKYMDAASQKPKSNPQPAKSSPKPTASKPPVYHRGVDYVPKTGPAILQKGEAVLKKQDAEKMRQGKSMAQPDNKETVHLSKHRVVMHLNKGGLHRALHIPEDQTIPQDRLEEAKNSKNPHVRQMANLAHTMESWKH